MEVTRSFMIITFSLLVVMDRIHGQQNKFKSVERPGKLEGLKTEAAFHQMFHKIDVLKQFCKIQLRRSSVFTVNFEHI